MRRKILIGIIITFLLLLLAVIILPKVFEAQLNARLKSEINNRVNAQVNYKNFSLSLIYSFPNVTFTLDDISIIGVEQFKEDTLAFIKRLEVTVDLKGLINGEQYQISEINIIEPHIWGIMGSNGNANWDIIKARPSGGTGAIKPSLFSSYIEEYEVQNGVMIYTNERNSSSAQIYHINLEGNANIINNLYKVSFQTKPVEFTYRSDSTVHQTVSGLLNFGLDFTGSKNDIEQRNYEAFQFSGKGAILNLQYTDSKIPELVLISNSQISITQRYIVLDSLNAIIGKSDIAVTGAIDNYISYLLNKGDLIGNLVTHSTVFDINEWLKKDTLQTKTKAKAGTTNRMVTPAKAQYIKVPAHIDLTTNFQFDRILSDKLVIKNLKGQLLVKDEAVNLGNVTANLLGGSATLSAKYDTKNTDHPDIKFAYSITKMDIRQAYNDIKAIGEVGPGIKYVTGNCSGNINGSGKLKPDMSVDYNSLIGTGKIFMTDAKISELPALNEIYKVTKIPSLQNLEAKDAQTNFAFKNGRVVMQPTDLKFSNGYSMYLQGSSGFDQTIDYDMKLGIPAREVVSSSPVAQEILSFLPGLASNLPQTMDFIFKITGNAIKPQVKLINMAPADTKK